MGHTEVGVSLAPYLRSGRGDSYQTVARWRLVSDLLPEVAEELAAAAGVLGVEPWTVLPGPAAPTGGLGVAWRDAGHVRVARRWEGATRPKVLEIRTSAGIDLVGSRSSSFAVAGRPALGAGSLGVNSHGLVVQAERWSGDPSPGVPIEVLIRCLLDADSIEACWRVAAALPPDGDFAVLLAHGRELAILEAQPSRVALRAVGPNALELRTGRWMTAEPGELEDQDQTEGITVRAVSGLVGVPAVCVGADARIVMTSGVPNRPGQTKVDSYTFAVRSWPTPASDHATAIRTLFQLPEVASAEPVFADVEVPDVGILIVTGASGSGKSTLLRMLASDSGAFTDRSEPGLETVVIDHFTDPRQAVNLLTRFGLGEPRILTQRVGTLSDGQRERLRVALLFRDPQPAVIVIDEFLTGLDASTARIVAYNVQRYARRQGVRLVVATPCADLAGPLGADAVIELTSTGEAVVRRPDKPSPRLTELEQAIVVTGTVADYAALRRYHYRYFAVEDEPDSTFWEVRSVRIGQDVAGVACYAPPVTGPAARLPLGIELNRRIRVIQRVIVHPRYRGLGLVRLLEYPPTDSLRCLLSLSSLEVLAPFHHSLGYQPVVDPLMLPDLERTRLQLLLAEHQIDVPRLRQRHLAVAALSALPDRTQAEVRALCLRLHCRQNVAFLSFLAQLAGERALELYDAEQVTRLFTIPADLVSLDDLAHLLPHALPGELRCFVRRLNQPGQFE